MCKYCQLTGNEYNGDLVNKVNPFMKIKDGSQVVDVRVHRYINEDEGIHDARLIMDYDVLVDSCTYTIKDTSIHIKYCPFCGEKL